MVGQVVRLAGEEGGLFRVGVEFLVYRGDARERIAAFVEAEPRPATAPAPRAAALPLTVRPFEEAREWEEELRASEIRKALILDSALDCILTADHEGRVIEFNAAARRLFGYTPLRDPRPRGRRHHRPPRPARRAAAAACATSS